MSVQKGIIFMKAVIMAGGKGTRLESLTKGEIPKPMIPIKEKPLLLWQIEELKRYGIVDITMIIGHLGEKITEYFGNGEKFGVNIDYILEEKPLGTAGAFYYLKDKLSDEYFLLVFGDIFFDIDIDKMEAFHKAKKAKVTLFAHPNAHPYDSDLVETDADERVVCFDSKNNKRDYWYDNMVNAGIYILDKTVCDKVSEAVKTDFEKDILAAMATSGEAIYAYKSPEYVKDVGTVDRIEKAVAELDAGLIERKNLSNKQSAIFLDRDGTINKLNDFIYKAEDLLLEDGVIEAIRAINSSGLLAIVITNQPAVARGLCDIGDIDYIHKKLKTLLGKEGVFLDDIFYCPHHPDKGYPEENPLYKIDCECRKPKTGMIELAKDKFNIDLASSYMIGDSSMDIELAKRAGLKSVLVMTGLAGKDNKYDAKPDYTAKNLYEAVQKVLSIENISKDKEV